MYDMENPVWLGLVHAFHAWHLKFQCAYRSIRIVPLEAPIRSGIPVIQEYSSGSEILPDEVDASF